VVIDPVVEAAVDDVGDRFAGEEFEENLKPIAPTLFRRF
jgi:hypothetical protein